MYSLLSQLHLFPLNLINWSISAISATTKSHILIVELSILIWNYLISRLHRRKLKYVFFYSKWKYNWINHQFPFDCSHEIFFINIKRPVSISRISPFILIYEGGWYFRIGKMMPKSVSPSLTYLNKDMDFRIDLI